MLTLATAVYCCTAKRFAAAVHAAFIVKRIISVRAYSTGVNPKVAIRITLTVFTRCTARIIVWWQTNAAGIASEVTVECAAAIRARRCEFFVIWLPALPAGIHNVLPIHNTSAVAAWLIIVDERVGIGK